MLCNNWLGFSHYSSNQTRSERLWIQGHNEVLQSAKKKRDLQNIKENTKKSAECFAGKSLPIVKGSFQDEFNHEQFSILELYSDPDVYSIRPFRGGQVREVNRQLEHLGLLRVTVTHCLNLAA